MTEQPPSGYTPPPPTAPPPAPPSGQPGYPPYPSYPAHPQYPAYPAAQYPYPYGPYAYPYGGYPPPSGPRRPGVATTAAILAFVLSGLLMVAGLVLFLNASIVHSIGEQGGFDLSDATAELAFDAVVDFVAGGLMLAGGLMMLGRKPHGRTLVLIAAVIDLGCAIYWLVRAGGDLAAIVFWAVVFLSLGVLTGAFTVHPSARRWLAGADAASRA
jgi:hypothetical protein